MRASSVVRALRLVGAAGMALDAALVNSVQCSKEARKTLSRASVAVEWVEISAGDCASAREIDASRVLGASTKCDHGSEGWEAFNAESRREYEALYAPAGLDPANNELETSAAVALVRSLGLRPEDAFLDLGSSAGSLVLAAAWTSAAARCHGVELSPRSHRVAAEARDRFAALKPDRAGAVEFFNSDLRAADVSRYSVLFCAIRGVASRPRVLHDVLTAACDHDDGRRLVCAGFGVDLKRQPYADRVSLAKATVLAKPNAPPDAPPAARSLPLYGTDEGPRVLLEYAIAPRARAGDPDT